MSRVTKVPYQDQVTSVDSPTTEATTSPLNAGVVAPFLGAALGDAAFAAFVMADPLQSRSAENFAKMLSATKRMAILLVEAKEALRAIELAVDGLNTKGYQQQKNTQSALDRIKGHARAILAKLEAK